MILRHRQLGFTTVDHRNRRAHYTGDCHSHHGDLAPPGAGEARARTRRPRSEAQVKTGSSERERAARSPHPMTPQSGPPLRLTPAAADITLPGAARLTRSRRHCRSPSAGYRYLLARGRARHRVDSQCPARVHPLQRAVRPDLKRRADHTGEIPDHPHPGSSGSLTASTSKPRNPTFMQTAPRTSTSSQQSGAPSPPADAPPRNSMSSRTCCFATAPARTRST